MRTSSHDYSDEHFAELAASPAPKESPGKHIPGNTVLNYLFYSYKGREYRVIGIVKMKNPATGIWVNAVQYQLYNDQNSPVYVRESEDFIKKFEGFTP